MPRYWQDPDTGDVIKSNEAAPADPGDVVVVPADVWSTLVRAAEAAAAHANNPPPHEYVTCTRCWAVQATILAPLGLCYLCCEPLPTGAHRSPEAAP